MKKDLIDTIGRSFNKISFKLKKHSPEILVVTGVVGTVASTVMACKATTKVNDILDEAKDEIEKVHTVMNAEEYADRYTAEDGKKDLAIIYAQTGVKLVKLYGPSVVLGALSLGSILASNNILRKRNVALAAAYTAIDNSFKEYRGRVVERFGKEVDRQLKYNIKAKDIEETVVDENGKEKKTTTTVEVYDPNVTSDYARFFDEASPYWEKDSEYNLMFLKSQQAYANDKLKAQGYLFLNEVYDMLGIDRTKAGQVVGWVYNTENPIGDNYVDFGIYDVTSRPKRAFVNGYERNILLDFNVDGNIWDLM